MLDRVELGRAPPQLSGYAVALVAIWIIAAVHHGVRPSRCRLGDVESEQGGADPRVIGGRSSQLARIAGDDTDSIRYQLLRRDWDADLCLGVESQFCALIKHALPYSAPFRFSTNEIVRIISSLLTGLFSTTASFNPERKCTTSGLSGYPVMKMNREQSCGFVRWTAK
jgi:hypothetical protein